MVSVPPGNRDRASGHEAEIHGPCPVLFHPPDKPLRRDGLDRDLGRGDRSLSGRGTGDDRPSLGSRTTDEQLLNAEEKRGVRPLSVVSHKLSQLLSDI